MGTTKLSGRILTEETTAANTRASQHEVLDTMVAAFGLSVTMAFVSTQIAEEFVLQKWGDPEVRPQSRKRVTWYDEWRTDHHDEYLAGMRRDVKLLAS